MIWEPVIVESPCESYRDRSLVAGRRTGSGDGGGDGVGSGGGDS